LTLRDEHINTTPYQYSETPANDLKFGLFKNALDSLLELDGVQASPLLGQPGGPPLPQRLVLDTPGLHLLGQVLGSGLFGLGLVDVLHQDSLVLEGVTLGLEVERVVPAQNVR
jgi:hypothetical protein